MQFGWCGAQSRSYLAFTPPQPEFRTGRDRWGCMHRNSLVRAMPSWSFQTLAGACQTASKRIQVIRDCTAGGADRATARRRLMQGSAREIYSIATFPSEPGYHSRGFYRSSLSGWFVQL